VLPAAWAAELAIAAFRRQVELYRRAGDVLGESVALGNVGSAQLAAGDLDAAIESLRKSVDGLRRIDAPWGVEFRLSRWRSLWPGAVMTSTFFRSRARRSTTTVCWA
jgi:Tetratricopeptide repeat